MAIQLRRGSYSNLDAQKAKPAEVLVVQSDDPIAEDGKAVYVAFQAGSIKRMATYDELDDYNTEAEAILESVQQEGETLHDLYLTAVSTINEIDTKIEQIMAVKTEAESIATAASNKADRLELDVANLGTTVDSLSTRMTNTEGEVASMIHDWYVNDSSQLVFLDANDDPIGDPIEGIGGSGGGGGSDVSAEMTAENTTGWISQTFVIGDTVEVEITWSSIENESPTGNGTAIIKVDNITKATYDVPQGAVTFDVTNYLSSGNHSVKITIEDVYGQKRTKAFNISILSFELISSFDASTPFEGTISIPFTPIGDVSKTIYIKKDGTVYDTVSTSVSNRQITYTLPAQSHGAHTLELYFEATVNNQTVRSNVLYFEFISIEALNNTPIIVSSFNKSSVTQYDSVIIPYTVYDPANATTSITLALNGTTISTLSVDRSEHSYTYRADTTGSKTFTITCGSVTKTFTFTVNALDINVSAETQNLALYLSAQGRSNNEANPETWTYGNITTTFTDFNGTNDRWQKDSDGIDVCRVSGDARLNISYQPHASDFRTTGKTIEIEFATRNILDYDASIISCMSGDRGFSFTAQRAILKSEQSSISTQYKEDEHVRIAFVAQKRSENRLLLIYINGICSGAIQYPDDDDFSQATPVNITIGSSYCTTDLYCIRIYDNDLTKEQILNNWIADTQIGATLVDRYTRNNVYDAYGNIVISQLPNDLPYLIISCAELPQYKGDKKTCSITFVNPLYPSRSYTSTNVQIDVQGTSSQYYERKNYKTKHRSGFTTTSGTASTYAMNSNAIATNSFCFKADVASSEGANNVELARLYNDICPYQTPAQENNSKVRQGIDGFPIVVFWQDTVNDTVSFLGKYNYNNDKGTSEVFGFNSPDESIEIKNNTSLRVLWKSADFSGTDYLNDFEWRYPDTDPAYTDATQLAEFAEWLVSTDTTAATNDALESSVTYDGTTYTNDTAAYRLAKFKAEAEDYMELDSALFYYLFTELFLMVDSRAKNAFPSFIGSTIE